MCSQQCRAVAPVLVTDGTMHMCPAHDSEAPGSVDMGDLSNLNARQAAGVVDLEACLGG